VAPCDKAKSNLGHSFEKQKKTIEESSAYEGDGPTKN